MSTHSMTGFGEGVAEADGVRVAIEIKSVNSRFLDVSCRMPTAYSRFESELQTLAKESCRRGRLEIFVNRSDSREPDYEIQFNQSAFSAYWDISKQAFTLAGVSADEQKVSALTQILSRREVVEASAKEIEVDGELTLLKSACADALASLLSMREKEGKALHKEVSGLLKQLEGIIKKVEKKAKGTPIDFQARLKERLERVAGGMELDDERLAQEVAILADKVDVTEELVRLQSHFAQFREIVSGPESGRKLEFLLQEFTREINTIGSKAQNSEITAHVVDAKALVEKLKEQVANIE